LVEPFRLINGGFEMPKTRPPYSPEFRRQMVDLVRAGRTPEDLSREFEPTAQSISNWVVQADKQEGRREEKSDGLTAAERDELVRLRRENKQLRLERDILSRAAAGSASLTIPPGDRLRRWFARETGAVPSGSSHS
jgi:transposase